MKKFVSVIVAPALILTAQPLLSCSTFLVRNGETILIGHNLDETIETSGVILVNKRGVTKHSVSYSELRAGRVGPMQWTSKFGSVTYNVWGREFPDGGMNEAGLYVGEMTLLGSVYPKDPKLVKMYHCAWMQYLLDNFETVSQVVESLSKVTVEGHCQWHFFIADRNGDAAVIEFDEGKTLVYRGDELPAKVSTNYNYPSSLRKLATFKGFGGERAVERTAECGQEDLRFVWAASMIRELESSDDELTPDDAFDVLRQMWCRYNRWSLVFDPKSMRVYFQTHKARDLRWVDFASFDFSCATPVSSLDIDTKAAGDVASLFETHTDERNQQYIDRFLDEIGGGLSTSAFFKRPLKRGLQSYPKRTACAR